MAAPPTTRQEDDLRGMDAYTADGVLIGRVTGYVERALEDELAAEQTIVDPIKPDGTLLYPPRLVIEGHGLPLQTHIVVRIDQLLDIDIRSRRITLRETIAQLRDNFSHQTLNHP